MKCEVCNKNKAIKETAYQTGNSITLVSVCSECAMDIEDTNHILNTRYEVNGEVK
ncbi:hypothetical protein [Brachyspira hyodysenteriae]|uniref:hypothetical protein n=1 Tax=Brachyspira hyodysenteriae TaxID=159 RepID=UPI000AF477FE|nr:hypothetical protein [Brachyspira hyodysenteriae]MCZ9888962.1 hypothetical protein [Brachyspira hyodysenteriae]